MLSDMHFRNLRQKMLLKQRTEEAAKRLEASEILWNLLYIGSTRDLLYLGSTRDQLYIGSMRDLLYIGSMRDLLYIGSTRDHLAYRVYERPPGLYNTKLLQMTISTLMWGPIFMGSTRDHLAYRVYERPPGRLVLRPLPSGKIGGAYWQGSLDMTNCLRHVKYCEIWKRVKYVIHKWILTYTGKYVMHKCMLTNTKKSV